MLVASLAQALAPAQRHTPFVSHTNVSAAGSEITGAGLDVVQSGVFCAPDAAVAESGDGGVPAPCQHNQCGCCILCGSSQYPGGLAALTSIPAAFQTLPLTRLEISLAWRTTGGARESPSGWTSSWSQRAPPRLS